MYNFQTRLSTESYPKYLNTNTYEAISNKADTGVFVMSFIDFIDNDAPVKFRESDVMHFRQLFCHYVLNSEMLFC